MKEISKDGEKNTFCEVEYVNGSQFVIDCRCDDIQAALPELCKLGAPDFLLKLGQLEVVCGARFTRHAGTIDFAGSVLEIALDSGVLMGGGKEIPLCEVEVELKEGNRESMETYAAELAGIYNLKIEEKSKFARALALYHADTP